MAGIGRQAFPPNEGLQMAPDPARTAYERAGVGVRPGARKDELEPPGPGAAADRHGHAARWGRCGSRGVAAGPASRSARADDSACCRADDKAEVKPGNAKPVWADDRRLERQPLILRAKGEREDVRAVLAGEDHSSVRR